MRRRVDWTGTNHSGAAPLAPLVSKSPKGWAVVAAAVFVGTVGAGALIAAASFNPSEQDASIGVNTVSVSGSLGPQAAQPVDASEETGAAGPATAEAGTAAPAATTTEKSPASSHADSGVVAAATDTAAANDSAAGASPEADGPNKPVETAVADTTTGSPLDASDPRWARSEEGSASVLAMRLMKRPTAPGSFETSAYVAMPGAPEPEETPAKKAIDKVAPVETKAAPPRPSRNARMLDAVNLRAGPSSSARVITVVPKGVMAGIVSCKSWCQIVYDGRSGYVYSRFVEGEGLPARTAAKAEKATVQPAASSTAPAAEKPAEEKPIVFRRRDP